MNEATTATGATPDRSTHVVLGCNGPLGLELMSRLADQGKTVRGVCRSGRSEAPSGVEIVSADMGRRADAERVCQDASHVYCCIGVDYIRWLELWPPIIEAVLAAARDRTLIMGDNLYSYGPQRVPLTEDLPLTGYGRKPALRARMTELLLGAHAAGQASIALVRAADFYGPRVRNSMLGERLIEPILKGKPVQLLGDIDQPHSFSYLPDFARAMVSVAEDPEACGQIWHVPNAPALSLREMVEKAYELAQQTPSLRVMPSWLFSALSLVDPLLRELREMRFLWDRPYQVDHGKFAARFWSDFTPPEMGLARTLDWYRDAR